MGLFFRSEVQVGVAVLVENSLDCVADDVIFSSVYFGEDITQGLQIFGHDTCSVMGDTCKIQRILLTSLVESRRPSIKLLSRGDIENHSLHCQVHKCIFFPSIVGQLLGAELLQESFPVGCGNCPARTTSARTRVSVASVHGHTWASTVSGENQGWLRQWDLYIPALDIFYY